MKFRNVFYYGKSEPRATRLPAARTVDTVEALEEPRKTFCRNALPLVAHLERDKIVLFERADFYAAF